MVFIFIIKLHETKHSQYLILNKRFSDRSRKPNNVSSSSLTFTSWNSALAQNIFIINCYGNSGTDLFTQLFLRTWCKDFPEMIRNSTLQGSWMLSQDVFRYGKQFRDASFHHFKVIAFVILLWECFAISILFKFFFYSVKSHIPFI